ncbi:FAD/NAD(P)-binding domain-containing protein [Rhizodiscina lignyota]|uniref:FAD/NAD(P)-binding domain-containing protein n=1 Tax=Rhizodiscina lignyota TaxID=1504668 RepID=A0A9P4IPD4_9PEZI|nr:FAD/NAD(P)-binding domain-containing protein [Rhizodiscina lignyota]
MSNTDLTGILPGLVTCRVSIVGGGIGGLTAAIALRRAGHEVHVYEQSSFASETGAAIHLTPNANSVLHQLGVDHEGNGGDRLGMVSRLLVTRKEALESSESLQVSDFSQNWLQTYRIGLHRHLKETALSLDGTGAPVQLHTSSRIMAVNPHKAIITLEGGETIKADVVVGADGVRSRARLGISEERKFVAEKAIQNAFRFMIPIQRIKDNPQTTNFLDTLNSMDMYYADDRKVVQYLCEGGTSVNFVCCHPAHLTGEYQEGYNHKTSIGALIEVYKSFKPALLDVMALVDEADLKIHPLLDIDTLPTYTNDRLVVLGDAAHPFTPHLAQGAAMAIEDGASLGVMLSGLDTKDDIPERLQLYNKARHGRASLIQDMSRMTGHEPTRSNSGAQIQKWKVHEFLFYGFSHDEIHFSSQILREYKWSKAPRLYWRQPICFGPLAGPRQAGLVFPRPDGLSTAVSITASIRFRTSATLLRNLFPSPAYRFSETDTVAEASFTFQTIDNLSWLGHKGYELVMFQIHGVQVESRDGHFTKGSYIAVVLENLADPIVSGREELGWPKLYSEINFNHNAGVGGDLAVELSWRGVKWASFSWKQLRETENSHRPTPALQPGQEHMFVHKYIPATTDSPCKALADADYTVLIPPTKSKAEWQQVASDAGFEFLPQTDMQLPTLSHIANRLSELPMFGLVEATVKKVNGQDDFSAAKRLE